MEDNGLYRSEEKGDCTGNHAHFATSAHDVCDGLAGRVLRTNLGRKGSTLDKDLLRSCLGKCELPVDGTTGQSSHYLPCEFLPRHGVAYEGGGEMISEGAGNLDGRVQ